MLRDTGAKLQGAELPRLLRHSAHNARQPTADPDHAPAAGAARTPLQVGYPIAVERLITVRAMQSRSGQAVVARVVASPGLTRARVLPAYRVYGTRACPQPQVADNSVWWFRGLKWAQPSVRHTRQLMRRVYRCVPGPQAGLQDVQQHEGRHRVIGSSSWTASRQAGGL